MAVQTAEDFVHSDVQKVFAHTQACVTYRSITVRPQTKTDRLETSHLISAGRPIPDCSNQLYIPQASTGPISWKESKSSLAWAHTVHLSPSI